MTESKLLLFDVDGTLTEPRKKITSEMKDILYNLRKRYILAIVGGSDLDKIREQLGTTLFDDFDYIFTENGTTAYKNSTLINQTSITQHIGEIDSFIKYCQNYISNLNLPFKRETFIEIRNGMINISPVGRTCTSKERDEFELYDNKEKIRETMIQNLQNKFSDLNLDFLIGGQISFDVFPKGWDKTYCLRFLEQYSTIHFFGDKTSPGGNDHALYINPKVTGFHVDSYHDTMKLLTKY